MRRWAKAIADLSRQCGPRRAAFPLAALVDCGRARRRRRCRGLRSGRQWRSSLELLDPLQRPRQGALGYVAPQRQLPQRPRGAVTPAPGPRTRRPVDVLLGLRQSGGQNRDQLLEFAHPRPVLARHPFVPRLTLLARLSQLCDRAFEALDLALAVGNRLLLFGELRPAVLQLPFELFCGEILALQLPQGVGPLTGRDPQPDLGSAKPRLGSLEAQLAVILLVAASGQLRLSPRQLPVAARQLRRQLGDPRFQTDQALVAGRALASQMRIK